MTAAPKQPLVERAANVIHRKRQELGFGGQAAWECEPSEIRQIHLATAQAVIAECQVEEMASALKKCLLVLSGESMSKSKLESALAAGVAALAALDGKPSGGAV